MKKILMFGLILLFGLLVGCKSSSDNTVTGTNYNLDDFAKSLTEKGVKMYGADWCSHCQNQKALFGKSFQYIDYIDCDKQKQVCVDRGIKGFPTWEIDGKLYPGEQSLERMAQLSGTNLQ